MPNAQCNATQSILSPPLLRRHLDPDDDLLLLGQLLDVLLHAAQQHGRERGLYVVVVVCVWVVGAMGCGCDGVVWCGGLRDACGVGVMGCGVMGLGLGRAL